MKPSMEKTTFDLNEDCDSGFHIHTESCYVMFRENAAGLAKIIRALKPYHSKVGSDGDMLSFVGTPHEICIVREKLQAMRFELL